MLQIQRTVFRSPLGSGCRCSAPVEPWSIPSRSPGKAFARRPWMEVRWNASAGMLEDAAVVAAKIAVIVHAGAARIVGGVIIEHGTAAPIGRPTVKTPSVVGKQPDGNADRGKSKSETDRETHWRWTDVKARVGRNPANAIDAPRIVVGHVHQGGIYRSDQDLAAVVIHTLLRRGTQIAGLLRLHTRGLDRVHHIAWLVVVGIAELGAPVGVA